MPDANETAASTTEATGPLKGIRVLDLTTVVLGPFCTQTLGDWGAEVVKIEPPTGDIARNSGLYRNRGMASVFINLNRNKRSLAIDLKAPEGKEALRRLIPQFDVLVTNIRPAGMARLGFGPDECRALNPRMVFAVATGFGQDGPHRARPAFDEIIQASSGLADLVGEEAGEPRFVPALLADKLTGMALLSAVLGALLHRERTGEAQMVEVPMLETLTAFNSVEHLGGLAFEPPIGEPGYKRLRHRKPARTKDGWITLLPYSSANWVAFFTAAGRPELIETLHLNDPVQRNALIDQVYAALREVALERTTEEWLALCQKIDVPATAFTRIGEVTEHPHLKEVGMFGLHDHPSEGRIRLPKPPTRFEKTPANIRSQAPQLGEHTAEILRELGFGADEVAAMETKKVIRKA
jgi:formyl-CoA transferase